MPTQSGIFTYGGDGGNPCDGVTEDVIVVPDPGGDGSAGGPVIKPSAAITPPTQPAPSPPPFPEPFLERPEPVSPDGQRLELEPIPPRPRPDFVTAMREVTVVSSNAFTILLPGDEYVDNVVHSEDAYDPQGTKRASPSNGLIWLSSHPQSSKDRADLMRWHLGSVWHRGVAAEGSRHAHQNNTNSEQFGFFAIGPNEDPWSRKNTRQEQFLADEWGRVLDVVQNPASSVVSPGKRYYTIAKLQEAIPNIGPEAPIVSLPGPRPGEALYKEVIRLSATNPIDRSNRLQYNRPEELDSFTSRYMPYELYNNDDLSNRDKFNIFQNVLLYGNRSQKWPDFVRSVTSNPIKEYYRTGIFRIGGLHWDYAFDAPVAFFEEEMNNMLLSPFHSANIESNVANVEFVSVKGYENELEVPNIYHHYNSLQLYRKYGNIDFEDPNSPIVNLMSRLGSQDELNSLFVMSQISKTYSSDDRDLEKYETRDVLKFPSDRVENLQEINKFMREEGYVQNYVQININTSQKGFINSVLQRNKMDRILLEIIGQEEWTTDSSSQVLDDSFKGLENEQNSVEKTLNDRVVYNIPLQIKDTFFDTLRALPARQDNMLQQTDNLQYPLLYNGWDDKPLLRFEESIKSQIFISEVERYISQNQLQRSYADILNGQKAYSEVVAYKIEKHEFKEGGEDEELELVQTFYLADSNDIDRIEFLDSQILPGKKYKYRVFTVNLVIATEYSHLQDSKAYTGYPGFDLKTLSWKAIYLLDAPFYEQDVETYDKPPLPPQVNFLPYQGVDDKFGILLTTNYGEIKEPRVKIFRDTGVKIGKEMTFKTDSLPSHFYGIRIEEEPEDYHDFVTSTTRHNFLVEANSNAGFSLQDIEPNKYYYYFFRTFDNYNPEIPGTITPGGIPKGGYPPPTGGWSFPSPSKDHPFLRSNPGEVFRVRMVSYQNGIFMEMEPYEMHKKQKEAKVDFERYLKISPNFDQKIINFSKVFSILKPNVAVQNNSLNRLRKDLKLMGIDDNQYIADSYAFQKTAPSVNNVSLGIKKDQKNLIWSKKFKIRIKSKTTGKVIDLNVEFKEKSKTRTNDKI